MRILRFSRIAASCFSAAAIFLFTCSIACGANDDRAAAPGGLPRYALKIGQEIHYSGKGSFKYDKGAIYYASDWKIWVTRANTDGSWRLVIENADSRGSDEAKLETPDNTLACIELFPDGRITQVSPADVHFQPRKVFARLPSNEAELKSGWTERDTADETTYRYSAAAAGDSGAKLWKCKCVEEGIFDKIYLSMHEDEFSFDRAQGLMQEIKRTTSQKWGLNGAGTSQLGLKEVAQRDADWISSLDHDMERYTKAAKEIDALDEKIEQSGAPEPLLDEAKELWTKQLGEVTNKVVKDVIQRRISDSDSSRQYQLEEAKKRAGLVGKAAVTWEASDLDGKPHKLTDYRGKVVVLDFWYRGCGWCIRSMPQINQVVDDFASEPVAVLGMNTDSKIEDAKFVVDAIKLKYPSMHIDHDLPGKYGVSGFPTFIVIDKSGNVSDVHVGYSTTLRESLAASIRTALKSEAKAAPQSTDAAPAEPPKTDSAKAS